MKAIFIFLLLALARSMFNSKMMFGDSDDEEDSYNPTDNCKKCHGLVKFETPTETYSCDVCQNRMLKGETAYGCRKCNYDVCKTCYTEQEKLPEPNSKVIDLDMGLEDKCFLFREENVPSVLKRNLGAENLRVEAVSRNELIVKQRDTMHPLVAAVHEAYDQHLSLTLSPDHFWILILQGVSNFIEANKDQKRFRESIGIKFEGKQTIEITRNDFEKGSSKNDWPSAFEQFKDQIKEFAGTNNVENFVQKFSTTTNVEEAVMNLSLMDGYKSFFNYEVNTCCGIRQVKLLGKLEDWEKLRDRSLAFAVHGGELTKWIFKLRPILDNLVKTYETGSTPEDLFWKSIYKHHYPHGSGSVDTVDGWITNFFPYHRKNGELKQTEIESLEEIYAKSGTKTRGNLEQQQVPSGFAHTPFKWNHLGTTYDMMFSSGFVGYQMENVDDCKFSGNVFLKPILGWAVSEIQGKVKTY